MDNTTDQIDGARKVYKFEAGHIYGNWRSALSVIVTSRTACYVTLKNGARKRIRAIHLGDGTYSEVIGPRRRGMQDLKVWAAADYGEA